LRATRTRLRNGKKLPTWIRAGFGSKLEKTQGKGQKNPVLGRRERHTHGEMDHLKNRIKANRTKNQHVKGKLRGNTREKTKGCHNRGVLPKGGIYCK